MAKAVHEASIADRIMIDRMIDLQPLRSLWKLLLCFSEKVEYKTAKATDEGTGNVLADSCERMVTRTPLQLYLQPELGSCSFASAKNAIG